MLLIGVILKFKGKAKVKWSEGTGDDKRTYSAKEKYFSQEVNLLGASNYTNDIVQAITYDCFCLSDPCSLYYSQSRRDVTA